MRHANLTTGASRQFCGVITQQVQGATTNSTETDDTDINRLIESVHDTT
jgi:hypothetical protein